MISWLSTYLSVTTMVMTCFSSKLLHRIPAIMPITMPMSNLRGRLIPFFSEAIEQFLLFSSH